MRILTLLAVLLVPTVCLAQWGGGWGGGSQSFTIQPPPVNFQIQQPPIRFIIQQSQPEIIFRQPVVTLPEFAPRFERPRQRESVYRRYGPFGRLRTERIDRW